jgi:hypothetical protein
LIQYQSDPYPENQQSNDPNPGKPKPFGRQRLAAGDAKIQYQSTSFFTTQPNNPKIL